MLTINLVKDITYLFLCQPFGVEYSCQTVTFLLLVAQDSENLRMEVAITVTGNTKFKFATMAIGRAWTIAIALIPRIINEKLAALSNHHTLKHYLH